MKLVIAEKPSVALSPAKVLGATKKHDGYLAGGGYLVSWCFGHLLKLAEPEQYDESLKIWTYETLPVIPGEWKYCVVCATDAEREGELIFRRVYRYAKCKSRFPACGNGDRRRGGNAGRRGAKGLGYAGDACGDP